MASFEVANCGQLRCDPRLGWSCAQRGEWKSTYWKHCGSHSNADSAELYQSETYFAVTGWLQDTCCERLAVMQRGGEVHCVGER
jgi:hypothetical protein